MDAPTGYQSVLFGSARIELDVLHALESRLELYEKISLVFLLYDETAVAQERLALLRLTENKAPAVLHDWACNRGLRWRETLVEALLIIQAYSDLSALGLDVPKLKDHFLPHQLETSLFVNPIKKVLYAVCEAHTKNDTKNLITSISCLCNSVEIDEDDFKYMELFIMKLIRKKYVHLGAWRNCTRSESTSASNDNVCNIESFAKCLSRPKFEKFYEHLLSVQKFMNEDSNEKTVTKMPEKQIELPLESSNNVNDDIIERYSIYDPKNMGYFLIINQKKFENKENVKLEERLGTDFDVDRLKSCWQSFGFEVIVLENVPHNQIIPNIFTYIKKSKHSHSAFAVCILSHGQNEIVYGSDSIPLQVTKIKDALCSNSDVLFCKPKLLIIQACRGDYMMRSLFTKDIRTDAPIVISPEPADLLVFWATVANYVSYRDINKGSWFIETLCECLTEFGDQIHLSDLFTKVNNKLSQKKVQISQFETTWRRTLQLRKSS